VRTVTLHTLPFSLSLSLSHTLTLSRPLSITPPPNLSTYLSLFLRAPSGLQIDRCHALTDSWSSEKSARLRHKCTEGTYVHPRDLPHLSSDFRAPSTSGTSNAAALFTNSTRGCLLSKANSLAESRIAPRFPPSFRNSLVKIPRGWKSRLQNHYSQHC
jgi:hypothetical protein